MIFVRAGDSELVDTSEILLRHADANGEVVADRSTHNLSQSAFFNKNFDFFEREIPKLVEHRLERIVSAAKLNGTDSVLDCGAGIGALIPFVHSCGVSDVTAVDLSMEMLTELKEKFDWVCCWNGDIVELPGLEFGPFDVIFFNAMFGNVYSQEETILSAIRLSKPGARLVISHPVGANFVEKLKQQSPQIVPHSLPSLSTLQSWVQTWGLKLLEYVDEEEVYIAVLKVTDASKKLLQESGYFWKSPLYLEGPVVAGFGRGSRQMGVPTANLAPEKLEKELEGVERGVYFGLVQVPELDSGVHGMVMNVGKRPTFVDGDGLSVEVHVLRKFNQDFYGKEMRVIALGFLRPEMKFSSLDELVERIHEDIRVAEEQLKLEKWSRFSADGLFRK